MTRSRTRSREYFGGWLDDLRTATLMPASHPSAGVCPNADPNEFAQISFPSRALKYMLNEIQNAENAGGAENGDELGIAADDGVSWPAFSS
jgi:hypothetical protein